MIEERMESQAFGEIAEGLLANGLGFRFQARGRSMLPLIHDGEILHVQRTTPATIKVGDIVLFRQGAEFKAHRIIGKKKDLFTTRGDASIQADSAIRGGQIVGKITAKECAKSGRTVPLEGLGVRFRFLAREALGWAALTVRRRIQSAFVLALLLAILPAAEGQVALDASTSVAQQVTSAANTVTLAHTTAGANRVLVVGVSMNISSTTVFNLTSANAASGGNTVYNGTITGGGANAYVGSTFTVAGFTGAGAPDNGTFTCTASTATTLTLNNAAGVARVQSATATATSFQSVSGVTYNGVALTRTGFHNDSTNVRRVEMWYLIAPATGTHNVVVTETIVGSAATIGTVVGATTFTGADQTSPIRSFASNDNFSNLANVTVASGGNDMVLDTLAIDGNHTVTGASGTQVQQWALASGAAGTDVYGYGSTHGGAPSVPMSESLSVDSHWSDAAVSIHPLQADVGVSVNGTSALFPTNLTYTITVTNNGPAASSGVTLTDTLASGLAFVSATPTQGSCSGTTTITCNLGALGVGASATVTVVATPGAPGGYPNSASVTATTPDLVQGNNSATGLAFSEFAACATTPLSAGGTLTGTINTYYPGTATVSAGSTSITLGAATGTSTPIASGDLVLIIQMQDAAINSSNSTSYGDGVSGSGSTALNNSGVYEYANATNAVPLGGGTLTVTAAGPSGGLLYTYTSAAASSSQGARTFQVVRVPNFLTATLSSTLAASAWNGATGGILALNVSGTLTLGSATVSVDGLGFRGGAGLQLQGSVVTLTSVANAAGGNTVYTGTVTGGAANALAGVTFTVAGFTNAADNGTFVATASTATTLTLANAAGVAQTHAATAALSPAPTNSDYLFAAPNSYTGAARIGADGSKAEGIAGTPHWVESSGTFLNTNQSFAEGYPNGSMARGAPGNAGGGGTDGDPTAAAPGGNDQNAGGGGGANGGAGGQGGDSWNSNLTTGGFGGTSFPASINRVVLGGGGGAGSSNNNPNTQSSSGSAGGGMVMIRAGSLTGSATITANGAAAYNATPNDAGGGAGAGGSIVIFSGGGGEVGLTVQAHGGRGGDAWDTHGFTLIDRHGPGGGGGGGVVLLSGGAASIDVSGGASGLTLTPGVPYGATAGTAGTSATNIPLSSSPGPHSAAICTDIAITKSGSPEPVLQNATLTYTLTVTNNGPQTAAGVVVVDTLPSQVTYVSSSTTLGSCTQSAGVVTCNLGAMASLGTATITITTTAATPSLALNTAVVNSTTPDPTLANNTATFTSTIEFPNAVRLNSFTAVPNGNGVLLSWRSGGEFHNLGFNVYRDTGGAKVQLNPSLIAGSALLMRETLDQHAAKTYGWIDRSPGGGGLYWLEDVDLNGTRTMHGPITAEAGPVMPQAFARATTMRDLAQANIAPGLGVGTAGHIREAVAKPVPSSLARNIGFQLAARPAVKIFVDHEGWYRITQPQLIAAGLDVNVDARSLHLFAEGVEQAIRVTGATSVFGPQAAIEFYGTAIDTPYSGQRVYWLMSSGQPGMRIPAAPAAGSSGPQAQSFIQTLELKPRTTYFAVLLKDDTDNFFGPLVSPVAAVQTLNVSNLAAGGGSIQVTLQGVTLGQQHDVTVAVNGATLGDMTFSGQQQTKAQFAVPAGVLTNGANTITLIAQQGDNDLSLVDHIELSFPHTFTAESDVLKFTALAGDSVTVNGFAQPPTRLVDITNPVQSLEVAYRVSPQNSGYALQMSVPWTSPGKHTLLALSDSQLGVAAALAAHQASGLHQPQAGADIVMLTAPQFAAQLQPLAMLHRAEGRPVALVSIDQVYDEFNFGERTPFAIRNFLKTATAAWKNQPHYLLLAGDASVDPRDYFGFGFFDFMPTRIVVTSELKTASDDWFSDFSNTGFAQIATGRLPARTVADAKTMVAKILSYSNGQAGSWTNQSMLVADTDDPSVSFTQAAQTVQKILPQTMNVSDVFAGALGTSTAQQAILAGINSGQLLVNYNGHGSVEIWGSNLFDGTMAASLTNGNRLPVFVMMNCLNGFFHDVFTQSLAESLLLAKNGGAVAVWASSGLTAPGPQFQMDQALVKTLFAQPSITMGDAVLFAKSGITDQDVRKTFILFGDPLMRLKQPGSATQIRVSQPRAGRMPQDAE